MPDTIYALSSGPLPSGVAVLRISGFAARTVLARMVGRALPARQAVHAGIHHPETAELIDRGLVLWFPGPASFTGEDCLELQLHGSRAVVAAALRALSLIEGLRPAESGEFTRRAFANGKMDLTEVEGLSDLIVAETESQRRQALAQAGGALRKRAEGWRGEILDMSASLVAALDFADEGDVPDDVASGLRSRAARLASELALLLEDSHRGEVIRDGATVVLAGAPNAGKSSLLNYLARRDAAIVSPIPGTTRDFVEVTVDMEGMPVVFVDTAGLRVSDDPVEQIGIERSRARARQADLVIWLSEDDSAPPSDLSDSIRVRSKSDRSSGDESRLSISSVTGDGLQDLLALVASRLGHLPSREPALVTQARQRDCLSKCRQALERLAAKNAALELAAEELRLAGSALDSLVGRIDIEDVLGAIFSRFCIGK